jgi:hypothetical protein
LDAVAKRKEKKEKLGLGRTVQAEVSHTTGLMIFGNNVVLHADDVPAHSTATPTAGVIYIDQCLAGAVNPGNYYIVAFSKPGVLFAAFCSSQRCCLPGQRAKKSYGN